MRDTVDVSCVNTYLGMMVTKRCARSCAVSAAGSSRSPGLPNLCHETGQAVAAPGGADPGRPVRQRHLPLWPGLLRAAPPPEDYRGGTCFYCHFSGV